MRKEAGYSVSDRVKIAIQSDDEVLAALESYRSYVVNELMADSLESSDVDAEEVELNGHQVKIKVNKV
jgi:isoleucyl-tRNA synthetase